MKNYRPTYYKNFRCIAGACKDSCCIGWEIDIDEKTADKYRNVSGDFGCRLKENILCDEEGSHFILKGERCPFLNEQNLCDIYINLGEEALCDICDQHPRYHEWYGDWKESGVGLCCEAAGKLIFSQNDNSFELCEITEEADESIDSEAFAALFAAREKAFKLAENGCFKELLAYGESLQILIEEEDFSAIREIPVDLEAESSLPLDESSLCAMLLFMAELEPIDPNWPALLREIASNIPQLLTLRGKLSEIYPDHEKNLRQLAVYFIFRYFCKALFDGDCLGPILLTVAACQVVTLLNLHRLQSGGSFGLDEQILSAKAFSKEIEYCTENLEALKDWLWEQPADSL